MLKLCHQCLQDLKAWVFHSFPPSHTGGNAKFSNNQSQDTILSAAIYLARNNWQ